MSETKRFTIEEMIENRMIWFKKNGTIDKRCSAFKNKIIDENCKMISNDNDVDVLTTSSDNPQKSYKTLDDIRLGEVAPCALILPSDALKVVSPGLP